MCSIDAGAVEPRDSAPSCRTRSTRAPPVTSAVSSRSNGVVGGRWPARGLAATHATARTIVRRTTSSGGPGHERDNARARHDASRGAGRCKTGASARGLRALPHASGRAAGDGRTRDSAGVTTALTRGPPPREGITNVAGPATDSSERIRSVTGMSDVETTNEVSARPAGPATRSRSCSTTTVPNRLARGSVEARRGSMRTSRGPSAPGATNKAAGPVTRSRGTSDTLPAQARGSMPDP